MKQKDLIALVGKINFQGFSAAFDCLVSCVDFMLFLVAILEDTIHTIDIWDFIKRLKVCLRKITGLKWVNKAKTTWHMMLVQRTQKRTQKTL